ncbi:hypothetical protein N7541_010071 [Penicillium brevicompactum]|uniref:Uncharacterized protein n=1 Tax=Penicillium brevicompactum TaxID=5074 RepID=A0A9W9QMT1_PENBR|nr:hypothetical protein N7541_010071 [Penicillium brevicompactum]
MFLHWLLSRIFALLIPFAVTATVYLYLYPVFNGCAFPQPHTQALQSDGTQFLRSLHGNPVINTLFQHLGVPALEADSQPAIFRLLVLADPQLEGDTSLPFPEYELYPRMQTHWRAVQESIGNASISSQTPPFLSLLNDHVRSNITTGLRTLISEDIPRAFKSGFKRLDLFGNDYYLAHIYRTLFWWTRPTHTTVLGDLVGSQWISDEEFARRGHRYWNRVFRGGQRIDENITRTGAVGWSQSTDDQTAPVDYLERTNSSWARRLINIAGNHDIGYAGDISETRMERFEREFGRANWDIRFEHPPVLRNGNSVSGEDEVVTPTLHLINLNTLMFDTPALSSDVQSNTYSYLNELIANRLSPVEDRSEFTLLLTHLPLHKEEGICTDGPYFSFRDSDDDDGPDGVQRWLDGGLKEQNHLSDFISSGGVLQGIFGMSGDENAAAEGRGRNGLILTGHDHAGCDVTHYINRTAKEPVEDDSKEEQELDAESPAQQWHWAAERFNGDHHIEEPSIREVTLRSMMGEFGGNSGLLSAWFDVSRGEWDYEITMCPAGVQHIWWAIHIVVLVTTIVGLLWFLTTLVGSGDVGMKPKKISSQVPSKVRQEKAGVRSVHKT